MAVYPTLILQFAEGYEAEQVTIEFQTTITATQAQIVPVVFGLAVESQVVQAYPVTINFGLEVRVPFVEQIVGVAGDYYLPRLEVNGSLVSGNTITGDFDLSLTVESLSVTGNVIHGELDLAVDVTGSLVHQVIVVGDYDIPRFDVVGVVLSGNALSASYDLALDAEASIDHGNSLAFDFTVALDVEAFLAGSLLSPTIDAVVLNVQTGSISEYKQFPFTSLFEFDGHWFGANDSGIFLLEGANDDGSAIAAEIEYPTIDLRDSLKRKGAVAWVEYKGGPMQATLSYDEGSLVSAETISGTLTVIEERRIKAPRGATKQRYLTVKLENVSGSGLEINGVSVLSEDNPKRVR